MLMVADSIGFSGTLSIYKILSALPGYYVSHGSRNFKKKTKIGIEDQTPEEFADSICEVGATVGSAIAIHTNMDPRILHPVCDKKGIDYAVIVREPSQQIESCYAFFLDEILSGNHAILDSTMAIDVRSFQKIGIQPNLANRIFIKSMFHVMTFNYLAVIANAKIIKMEEILNSEPEFRSVFSIPDHIEIPHFRGHQVHANNHQTKIADYPIAKPDQERLFQTFCINIDNKTRTWQDYTSILAYPQRP